MTKKVETATYLALLLKANNLVGEDVPVRYLELFLEKALADKTEERDPLVSYEL